VGRNPHLIRRIIVRVLKLNKIKVDGNGYKSIHGTLTIDVWVGENGFCDCEEINVSTLTAIGVGVLKGDKAEDDKNRDINVVVFMNDKNVIINDEV
jgi:hypothetical protein